MKSSTNSDSSQWTITLTMDYHPHNGLSPSQWTITLILDLLLPYFIWFACWFIKAEIQVMYRIKMLLFLQQAILL